MEKRYDINEDNEDVRILEEIAGSRNCFKKGSELDFQKASAIVLDDFRSGRLGRITLEKVKGNEIE